MDFLVQAYVTFQYNNLINKLRIVKLTIQHALSIKNTITELELINILKCSGMIFIMLFS